MKNEAELSAEYHKYKPEIDTAIAKVLSSGRYILGPEVARFEKRFAKLVGTKYALGVGSGYDALYLSFLAINTRDRYVYVKNELHRSTTNAAKLAGGIVIPHEVYADIVCVTQSKGKVFGKDKFIKGKVYVIDACQAIGLLGQLKSCWQVCAAGAFSFHPFKPLHCYGDGGAIVTNSKVLYEKLLALRNHGRVGKVYGVGCNSRLDEIQAAILNVYMDHIKELI